MSLTVKLSLFAELCLCLPAMCFAQLAIPPTPLIVNDDAPIVQTPPYSTLSDPQCESDGTIYLRHESADNNSWNLVRVSPDGSTQQTELTPVPGFTDMHTFAMATSEGGTVHEIVRAWGDNDKEDTPSIYYLQFDADGTFRSREKFQHEFIPAQLMPLPSGDFFSAGVLVKKQPASEDVEEVPLAGIFDSDTRLRNELQTPSPNQNGRKPASPTADSQTADTMQQGGMARLGDDGDIYVLLSTGETRVRVYRQSGEFRREMNLQQPFQEGVVTGLWISGGRMLVAYEGEADDAKDAVTYILYDAMSGQLIRAYRPQFTGTVACFQGGQSLTVLVNQKYSGRTAIASAELR